MNLEYKQAQEEDIERLYELSKSLIDRYENIQSIEYDKVLKWVHRKIENCISEYIFSDYQKRGIGTEIIEKCCLEANSPVYLYVFIKNQGAVALYERLGFKIVQTIGVSRFIMRKG